MTPDLLTPIFETKPASPYFFHGRLLSADDLRDEQEVQRTAHRRLGRALGAGVVEGLEVEGEPHGEGKAGATVVHVRKGLALNARGQALELAKDTDLALILPPPEKPTPGPGEFSDCQPLTAEVPASKTGFWVLTMAPVEKKSSERAPKSGLGVEGKIVDCDRRWTHEAVQFGHVQLDVPAELLSDEADDAERSRRRNIVAHLLFETERRAGFTVDPWARLEGNAKSSALLEPGLLDGLTECEVPLALLEWTPEGLGQIDLWAVRRRPAGPRVSSRWPTLVGEGPSAVAEAALLQFQEHLEKLFAAGAPVATLAGRDYFRHLPPAGILPLAGVGRPLGLMPGTFFAGRPLRDPVLFVEGGEVRSLLVRSLEYPPIDLDVEDETVWLYQVRENRQPAPVGTVAPAAPYLVFANGRMPRFGTARFDLSRWNFSNYGRL